MKMRYNFHSARKEKKKKKKTRCHANSLAVESFQADSSPNTPSNPIPRNRHLEIHQRHMLLGAMHVHIAKLTRYIRPFDGGLERARLVPEQTGDDVVLWNVIQSRDGVHGENVTLLHRLEGLVVVEHHVHRQFVWTGVLCADHRRDVAEIGVPLWGVRFEEGSLRWCCLLLRRFRSSFFGLFIRLLRIQWEDFRSTKHKTAHTVNRPLADLEKPHRIVDRKDVVDAELADLAHGDIERGKRQGEIPGRRQLMRIRPMDAGQPGDAADVGCLVLRGSPDLAADADLPGEDVGFWFQRTHDGVPSVLVEFQAEREGHPAFDILLHSCQEIVDLRYQDGVAESTKEGRPIAEHASSLEFHRVGLGRIEPTAPNTDGSVVRELLVCGGLEMEAASGADEDVWPGLLVQGMGSDGGDGASRRRVERDDVEAVFAHRGQRRGALGGRAEGTALHDLAHVVRDPEVSEAVIHTECSVWRWVIGAATDNDIKIGMIPHRLDIRLQTHLGDDASGVVDVGALQRRHCPAAGRNVAARQTGADMVLIDLGVDGDDLHRSIALSRDEIGDDLNKQIHMLVGAVSARGSDEDRHAVDMARREEEIQIALVRLARHGGVAEGELLGTAVGRAAVGDDGVDAAVKGGPEMVFSQAVAEHADGGEDFDLVGRFQGHFAVDSKQLVNSQCVICGIYQKELVEFEICEEMCNIEKRGRQVVQLSIYSRHQSSQMRSKSPKKKKETHLSNA